MLLKKGPCKASDPKHLNGRRKELAGPEVTSHWRPPNIPLQSQKLASLQRWPQDCSQCTYMDYQIKSDWSLNIWVKGLVCAPSSPLWVFSLTLSVAVATGDFNGFCLRQPGHERVDTRYSLDCWRRRAAHYCSDNFSAALQLRQEKIALDARNYSSL